MPSTLKEATENLPLARGQSFLEELQASPSAEAVVAEVPLLQVELAETCLLQVLPLAEAVEPSQAETGALVNAKAKAAIANIEVSFFKGYSF